MKLYLANGTHYEKQADVPKGIKFSTVEFPFAASPKADFVAWLNNIHAGNAADDTIVDDGDKVRFDVAFTDLERFEVAAKPSPVAIQPRSREVIERVDTVVAWLFDSASKHEVSQVFNALGGRFAELKGEAR